MGDVISNERLARSLLLFEGMTFTKRNISPTDIDGFIEYDDRYLVFIEHKRGDKDLDFGQKKAYDRLIKKIDEDTHCWFIQVSQRKTHPSGSKLYSNGRSQQFDDCLLATCEVSWIKYKGPFGTLLGREPTRFVNAKEAVEYIFRRE